MSVPNRQTLLRALPGVDRVLQRAVVTELISSHPRWAVVQAIRDALEALRIDILADKLNGETNIEAYLDAEIAGRTTLLLDPSLCQVINATGVVLHTNIGRAPLAAQATRAMEAVAAGYCNLEYDLKQGRRGNRHGHLASLLENLTGAPASLVTNNNAAAVMLAMSALAAGGEVIVSRGELVEIGGSFRVPDVIAQAGVTLVEVGTTNRTHLRDYRSAITDRTRAILKVHRSNFVVSGFTAEVSAAELSALGQEAEVPVVWDLGSGCLVDLAPHGLPGATTVAEAVESGADLITFSGDKLLGGPQAGLLCGGERTIDLLRSHPMLRALRPDKATLAGLEATLRIYRDEDPFQGVPTLRMLCEPLDSLHQRAQLLSQRIAEIASTLQAQCREVDGRVGGGAMPEVTLPSVVVALRDEHVGASAIERALRNAEPPVIARVERGDLLLDVRTIDEAEYAPIAQACAAAVGGEV